MSFIFTFICLQWCWDDSIASYCSVRSTWLRIWFKCFSCIVCLKEGSDFASVSSVVGFLLSNVATSRAVLMAVTIADILVSFRSIGWWYFLTEIQMKFRALLRKKNYFFFRFVVLEPESLRTNTHQPPTTSIYQSMLAELVLWSDFFFFFCRSSKNYCAPNSHESSGALQPSGDGNMIMVLYIW